MDIDLKVNDLSIAIGMSFNGLELSEAHFSQVGLLMGFTLPKVKQPDDIVLWAKNQDLAFFNGEAVALANSKYAISTDNICGTSVFLYFNNGYLRLAIAQIIMSYTWAQGFTDELRQEGNKNYGNAACEFLCAIPQLKGSSITSQTYLRCTWRDDKEFLISQLAPAGNNAYVFWGSIQYERQVVAAFS